MPSSGNLDSKLNEADAIRADFANFFKGSISGVLPPECIHGRAQLDVIPCQDFQRTRYNINYVLRNGEPGRRSEKQDIPERKIVKQSLQLYAESKGDLLKRLHVVIESENYFFEYI